MNLPAPPPIDDTLPVGWHPSPESPDTERWWDGFSYTTTRNRTEVLTLLAAPYIAAGCGIVEQTADALVLRRPPKANHVVHFILTLLTGGLWLFVWLFVAATQKPSTLIVRSDGVFDMAGNPARPG